MLTNLLRPWILARLLSGISVGALTLMALFVAWRVLREFRPQETSEGQLLLERRAELVATVVQAALGLSVFNLALTVLAADHLSGAIRGAMCAYGVFSANDLGFLPLGTSALASLGCVLWLVLHRLDLALPDPRLTRRKFMALFIVGPLILLDLWATLSWAFDLDLGVVATCCSTSIDRAGVQTLGAAPMGGRVTLYYLALATLALSVLALVALARRAGRPRALLAAALSALSVALSLPAIVAYVAPHVYENPRHLCPFCLLHADAWGIGWPLFASLFLGGSLGLGLVVLESQRRLVSDDELLATHEARIARLAALAFVITFLLCVFPVAHYAWISGGASLFGG
ncbi:MAG: hypothetical protein GXP55_06435 [Deltaproteobacteria bacterium]|nr:hypothetical protein [Deltaproteobacteria bacterium]